jgi:hypothetical protein
MHVHIRVPGLRHNLSALKKLASFIIENTDVYDLVDPLPKPTEEHADHMKQARKRYHWMRMSHMTKIPRNRVEKQCRAETLEEFFAAEVPKSRTGKTLWHAQPRAAINLRQLLQTETIEFRHFPQTLSHSAIQTAIEWCRDYLRLALNSKGTGGEAAALYWSKYAAREFPKLDTIYVHWQELRWLRTAPSRNRRADVERAIAYYEGRDAMGYDPKDDDFEGEDGEVEGSVISETEE